MADRAKEKLGELKEKGQGSASAENCPHWPWQVIIAATCVACIVASSLFWWYVAIAVGKGNIAGIVCFLVSGVLMVIFPIFGIHAAWRKSDWLLFFFGILMSIMFVIHMVVILLATISLGDCERDSVLTDTVCEVNQFVYYAHVFAVLIISLLASVFAFILRRIIKAQLESAYNYY
eukprot:TRINITY_DN920_c0_g1_i2.p1 TRINITY_DN920_c0_g1~~TRINITY_DN920_c0_g1_i2.p1  ORF type:complete len:176 (+),score=28.80 TRINITY_DN920_c0_g1_i2:199-726(+)